MNGVLEMRGDQDMRKVALQVSIALAAGMFSIVPVAYGAPVGGNPVVGGATISYSDVENVAGARDTNISSTTQNNVIDWHDFSVDKDEAVIFDGGDKTRNYMNVVTGANTSEINGVIKGGNEVYIVNPNGVIFGETASVDVGSLYASTRYVSDNVKNAINKDGTTMTNVLETASAGMATDIVNMGAINATNVVMEGQNIRFVNDTNKTNKAVGGDMPPKGVTATSVTLKADTTDGGYIHVGYNTESAPSYTGNNIEYYKLLGTDWSTIRSTINGGTSGKYMLSADVDAGSTSGVTNIFSGKFDGNNHVISKLSGPLFTSTSGADIYNVGVKESTFSGGDYAGSIVGTASYGNGKNTVLKNVYNMSDVTGYGSGGLVGYGNGVTISQSYNTGNVSVSSGSAFIGFVDSGSNVIEDSYSTGIARYGVTEAAESGSSLTINRVYTKGEEVWGAGFGTVDGYNILMTVINDQGNNTGMYGIYPVNKLTQPLEKELASDAVKKVSLYTGSNAATEMNWGSNISDTGGVVIDKSTGAVTRPVWRIYEGQTMPILTSQFKGVKNTVYNFGYFKSGEEEEDTTVAKYNNGYNNAKDLPAYTYGEELDGLVYNGEYLKMLGSDGKAATDSSAAFIKSEGKSVIDTSLVTYDTSGQKNATFTKTDQSSGTQNKWAMLYSSQKGYDLYGNNIEIAPRRVAAQTSDIGSVMIVKEYDGNSKASSKDIDNFFSGDSTTVSGILTEDAKYENGDKKTWVEFGGTAVFKKNGANASNVGVYTYTPKGENETPYTDEEWAQMSYVDIQGTLTLNDPTNNYILTDTSFTGKGQGVITQKTLEISLNHSDYSRVYNNHAVAKGDVAGNVKVDGVSQENSAVVASDFKLTVDDDAFTANDGGTGGTFSFTNDNGEPKTETVTFVFDDKAYYVESDKATHAYAKDDDGNPILKDNATIERADIGDYENRVRFGGLKLNGDTKENYKLVDSKGTVLYSANDAITVTKNLQNQYVITTTPAVTTGGSLYASGTVTQRPITSTGFSWKDNTDDVTRPYNGKWEYEEPEGSTVSNAEAATPDSGMLEGDSLTFTVQSAKFVNSEEGSLVNNVRTATPTKNVADAAGVLYTVQITGAAARNYTLDGADINTNGTNTVIGPGHITPRTINLIVNSAAKAEKDYDGTAESDSYTLTDSILSAGTGVLKYQSDDTANHFLGDIDPNANVTVTGTYQSMPAAENTPAVEAKDVYYNEATDTVLDKNIVYDAKVMEGSNPSQNYKFAIIDNGNTVVTALNADSTEARFAGTDALGVINQREIDEVVFSTTMTKTFDDDAEVKNIVNNGDGVLFKTNDRITVTDLKVNGESALAITGDSIDDVLNTTNGQIEEGSTGDNALIVGSYGKYTGNVWAEDKHAGDKVIRYTMRDAIWKTNNYKVTANAVIEGTGRIDTLPIDAVDIKIERNSTPITKIYNGDANVSTTADAVGNIDRDAKDYLNRVYVSKGGKSLNLDVSVDGAEFETRHHKNESGETDLRVTYTLGFADSTDYSIEGLNNNQLRRSVDADGNNITGSIASRPILVTTADIVNNDVEAGGVVKTYDALDTVNGSGEALVANINDQILSIDTDVTNATTGNYNNKHANSNDTANLDNDGLKPVTYNLALANNDTYGDYKFVDGNGTEIATLAGRGTINKLDIRPITTEADPVKTYDGDDTAENKLTTENTHFGLEADWDANKEIVVRDQIDLSKISGKYQKTGTEENAADVNRSDPLQKKNILYSGVLAALGENVGNYIVEDTFTGTGRINPGSIDHTSFIFNLLDNITQTYSGSADVGEYGMDNTAKDAFRRSWINTLTSGIDTDGDGTVDISLGDNAYGYTIETAAFDSANAGNGNKRVDYQIHVDANSINNYDYDEDDAITKDNIHLSDYINTGTINQRNITAYVTHDQLSKYYDKTEAIYNNDNPAYSGAAGGNVLTGAEAVTFKTYVADGTTTQTGLLPNYGANESFGEYDGAGVGTNNKIINYTAKVSDAYSNNYTFTLLDAENGNEVTALSTTQNTINPFGVVLTAGETTKVYDGLKDVTAEKAAAALQLDANYDNLALTNVNENTGKYDNPNRQGGAVHVVTYTGFELENPNYYLAKADGTPINTNDDGKNVITGDGYITRYTLTAIPNFTVHDVTKEYDGDDLVKYNRSSDQDLIKQNFVTPENIPSSLAYELNSATYTDSNRGEVKHADFVIEISGDNYDFSYLIDNHLVESGTDSIVKTYSTDDAVISPRKVYVALKGNTDISKVYDGGLDLEDADMALIRTADQEIYIPDEDDILTADKANVHIDWSGIQAAYTEKDAGNDIPVKYTISLTNNAAGNYALYKAADGTAITDANKLTGSGAITKAVLNLSPEAINRSYAKGNSNITLDAGKLLLQGVNGETATFSNAALAKITGQYGKGGSEEAFEPDENVSWDGNTVIHKDVYYTGLSDALAVMNGDDNTNSITKNYTIANTAFFAADEEKGMIEPITITQAAVENWKPVIREYNADTDLNEVYDYAGNVKGNQLDIKDILNLTVDDIEGNPLNIEYTATGKYDNKNKGNDHVLEYHINTVTKKVKDGTGYANYVLDTSVLNNLVGQDLDSSAEQVYSVITPRQLNADVVKQYGNRKIYNGNENADTSNFVLDEADQAILTKDGILDKVVKTAKYNNKNASVDPDAEDTNTKTITYTLALNDNSGNYEIATPEASARGDIERRKVSVVGQALTGINKPYDGDDSLPENFANAEHFSLATTDDNTGIIADDADIQLDVDAINGNYEDKHAGSGKTINFREFKLKDTAPNSGGSADNYYMTTDLLTGTGTIYQKALNVGINAAPIKGYDATTAVSADYATVNNLDYLSGVLGTDAVNLQLVSADYATAKADTGKKYDYTLTIDNTDYKLAYGTGFTAESVSADGQSAVFTGNDGIINKRKVYVSLVDTPAITKVYDGTTSVAQDVTDKILVREGDLLTSLDGTDLDRSTAAINARYDTKDAATGKTVTYNVALTGSAADNYEIHRLANIGDAAADTIYSTLEGIGDINKAVLTLDPTAISKTYNGTAVIGDGTSEGGDAFTADKLTLRGVNNEYFTFTPEAFRKVSGQYGYGTGVDDFTADANVSWDGEEVAHKDLLYTGLSDALAVMNSSDSTNSISKNYTIDNTAYFTAAQAKGQIKPIVITQAATENWKPVIREYNADTDLAEVYDYSGGTKGAQLGIKDILQLTVDDVAGNALTVAYEANGNYDNRNVAGNHVLNYHINSVNKKVSDGTGHANYVLDTSVLEALEGQDLDSSAEGIYSVITPRQLSATIQSATGNRKIYDGTDAADTANFVLDADDQAVLEKDELLNNVVITAYYDDKHAGVAPGAADTNSKSISYTLSMTDINDNYEIATPTATARGDIEQRKVYVEPVDVTGIDKVYDSTTAMPEGYSSAGRFALAAADADTGIVTGEEEIRLDTEAIEGEYADGHVHRNADGTLATQDINFTNFTLQDTVSGNDNTTSDYYVATTGLTGSGTIKPSALTVGIKEAPVKVYDGETAISSTYAANDNLVLTGLYAGDSANLLIASADYDDANAGTNKGYTYNITIDNDDYELTQGAGLPDIDVTDNGQTGSLTASDGTIERRVLTVSSIADMTKVYDGTTDGVENAAANITLSNYITKDAANLGLTAVATYDNANAGISEDSDELEKHTVTYTLSLDNANYELEDAVVTGEGTISRKGLTVVATPAAINMGENMPEFTGTVEGLVETDSSLADLFTFATKAETTNNIPGSYGVYGWYSSRVSGNLGLNYTFAQDAANDTAFTVTYVNTNMSNPDTKIKPTDNIYRDISSDNNSGFGDTGTAAIEYMDKNGNVIGKETIDSGEIHGSDVFGEATDDLTNQSTNLANIGIAGNDIVNVEGADAANTAAIEVDGEASIINLGVRSGQDSSAEINNTDESTDSINRINSNNDRNESVAQIAILDDLQVIEEDETDKTKEKEGEIAIESSDSGDDEIELKVEATGVNVA